MGNLIKIDKALNQIFNETLIDFGNKVFDIKYVFGDDNKVKNDNKIQNEV